MTRHLSNTTMPRRGFALIAVMWVVILAGLMLLGVRRNSWANSAGAYNDLGLVRARWLARAGVEQAMAVLEDDALQADGAEDLWYDNVTDFQNFALLGGTFNVVAPTYGDDVVVMRYGLIDHAGLVNVNVAEPNQLARLENLDDVQIDCILDWRDGDDDIRPNGAEAGYYHRLPFPYEIRNDRLRTLAELRLIKDIDEQTFRGEDADLDGLLDANEDDAEASPPSDNADGVLQPGLAGLCTVYAYEQNVNAEGEQRIDMNRAGRNTLTQELNFTDALAEAVRQQRRNRRFRSVMDLVGLRGQSSEGENQTGSGGSSNSSSGNQVNEITLRWVADHMDEITVTRRRTLRGLINVNTASKDVLLTLGGLSVESAEAIVARRTGSKGAYTSVGQLLGDPLTEQEFRAVAEQCTVRSNVFEVRSYGVTDLGIRYEIIAVIDRGTSPMSILYWHESE